MISNQQIICLSSVDWEFNWQVPQEVMARFAAAGNTVLFIENTGVRVPRLRDLSRLRQRLRDWRKGTQGIRQVQDNLYVCSPLVLPFPYSRLAQRINRWIFASAVRQWMNILGFERPILWTFLPTRFALELIRVLDPVLTVYYCLADFQQLGPAHKVRAAEQALLKRADVVFAQGEVLAQRCREHHPRDVGVFPSGVNLEQFQNGRLGELPEELQAIPSPRLGYIGALQRHVDEGLLRTLATRHPEWNIVLVGPRMEEFAHDLTARNIICLGAKAHQDIPRYIAGFDVCLIPYALTEYTQTVYPTKLAEYLILGKPVVSTALPEVLAFIERYGPIVSIGHTYEGFERGVQQAIHDIGEAEQRQRIRAAEQESWAVRAEAMSQITEERLRQAERLRTSQWPALLRRAYGQTLRRAVRVLLVVGFAYLMAFKTPLLWLAAMPLTVAQPPQQADAIVVFAGGVGESGQAGEGYQERVKRAVELFHGGYAPEIVLVSGFTYTFNEAEIMRMLAGGLGVPTRAIRAEKDVTTTHDYVLQVGGLAKRERWRSLLVVTSPYHMRRMLLTFKRQAPDLQIIPTPASSSYYAHTWGIHLRQIRGLLHEYLGILYYRWKGWL